MKHAVLITAHNNSSVTKRLLESLDDERFTFYFLIDKKSKTKETDYISILQKATTKFLPRININWGGYSQIQAELLLIKEAINDKQEYLHFIQGADLALKTPDELDNFFEKRRGELFIDISREPSDFANYKVLCKHLLTNHRLFRTNRLVKILNHGFAHLQKPLMKCKKNYGQLYAGSALWSIPYDFGKHLIQIESEIRQMYRYSLAADEVFIQTICMNSEYRNYVSDLGAARLIDWKNRVGNSPKTFTILDTEEIKKAIDNPNIMFARKFNENVDFAIVEYISKNICFANRDVCKKDDT